MGDEAGAWFSRFLDKEGCHVYYMSPRHKARRLVEDPMWSDMTKEGDQVSYYTLSIVCSAFLSHVFIGSVIREENDPFKCMNKFLFSERLKDKAL